MSHHDSYLTPRYVALDSQAKFVLMGICIEMWVPSAHSYLRPGALLTHPGFLHCSPIRGLMSSRICSLSNFFEICHYFSYVYSSRRTLISCKDAFVVTARLAEIYIWYNYDVGIGREFYFRVLPSRNRQFLWMS